MANFNDKKVKISLDGDSQFVDNGEGEKIYQIPVQWLVSDVVKVRANSLEEAIETYLTNEASIPLGTAPEYVADSYKMSVDCETTIDNVKNIAKELEYNYGEFIEEDYEDDLEM